MNSPRPFGKSTAAHRVPAGQIIFTDNGPFATPGLRSSADKPKRPFSRIDNEVNMPSEAAVRNFITSAFRSVWALDLVQILHSEPERGFTRSELVEILRASDLVVRQSVASLLAAGLVIVDESGLVWLHAASPETKTMLAGSIQLYRRSPDKVRRIIVAQSSPGVTAFADAFRLRKD